MQMYQTRKNFKVSSIDTNHKISSDNEYVMLHVFKGGEQNISIFLESYDQILEVNADAGEPKILSSDLAVTPIQNVYSGENITSRISQLEIKGYTKEASMQITQKQFQCISKYFEDIFNPQDIVHNGVTVKAQKPIWLASEIIETFNLMFEISNIDFQLRQDNSPSKQNSGCQLL